MDFIAGATILGKEEKLSRLKENFHPNLTKTQNFAVGKWNPSCDSTVSTLNNNKNRRNWNFMVANNNSKREKLNPSLGCNWSNKADDGRGQKFLGVAHGEILGGSELGFIKNSGVTVCDNANELTNYGNCMIQNAMIFNGCKEKSEFDDRRLTKIVEVNVMADSDFDMKIRREKLLEDARDSVPEIGFGKVMHLVEAFEKILSIPKSKDTEESDEKEIKGTKKRNNWALPGMQPPMVPEIKCLVSSKSLGLHLSDLDNREGSSRASSRIDDVAEISPRNSVPEISGMLDGRRMKSTSHEPFNSTIEQRGSCKKEELLQKGQQMVEENERILVVPGLLVKPPVKERTRPIDLVLHSDIRAMERAEFDHQMAEKMRDCEQLSKKRERQQKLAEEEKIKRLEKELLCKAQSLPSLDRPCISKKRRHLSSTYQKPFNLRTERRGSIKKEEFFKKEQEMMEEEKQQRITLAQSLPWTTYEPGCMVKPPVKQRTRPTDLVLHSDIRAKKRAKFDHQVAEKMSLGEQYRMERERQKKLAEEEEIRRLRKELVPKAQPMPYFDRPFIPRRSLKRPTIPREPNLHIST